MGKDLGRSSSQKTRKTLTLKRKKVKNNNPTRQKIKSKNKNIKLQDLVNVSQNNHTQVASIHQ